MGYGMVARIGISLNTEQQGVSRIEVGKNPPDVPKGEHADPERVRDLREGREVAQRLRD